MSREALGHGRGPSATVSDAALLAALAQGDLEALGRLFDRHVAAVRAYLARLGVSAGDLDDLVQLTFLELPRAAVRYDAQLSARAWLFGIATIMVRRHRRSLGRAAARVLAWFAPDSDAPPSTPLELYATAELERRFERAFSQLSPKKREVFTLVVLQGLPGDEVAAVLGVPINTVWTRLHHARLELRQSLAEELP